MPKTVGDLLDASRLIVAVGAGGVGKTTMSVVLGFAAALRGKRVAVLSIDPAKRLAAALGLELDGAIARVESHDVEAAGGRLDATMLDHQAVFDELVRRYSPSPEIADKIQAHLFYKAASTNLAGAVELMALAKLEQLVSSGEYDLVVLDTPPDVHALDFISRPDALAKFIDHRVTTWMLKPFVLASKVGFGKVMQKGEKLMGGIAKVAGFKALQMMAEFLILMQEIVKGLHECGTRVGALLRSDNTDFTLICAPRSSSVKVAVKIFEQLREDGISVRSSIWNRSILALADPGELKSAAAGSDAPCQSSWEAKLCELREEEKLMAGLREKTGNELNLFAIPEATDEITSLAQIASLARRVATIGCDPTAK